MKNVSFILILFLSLLITSCRDEHVYTYKKVINLTDETIRLKFISEYQNPYQVPDLPQGKDSVVYLELQAHQDMLLRNIHELTTYDGRKFTKQKPSINGSSNLAVSQSPDSLYNYVFSHAYALDSIYNSQNVRCKNHTWETYPIGKNTRRISTLESVLKVRPEDFQ